MRRRLVRRGGSLALSWAMAFGTFAGGCNVLLRIDDPKQKQTCGDGETGGGCDDGDDAIVGVCGDGIVSSTEGCDDGNAREGDGCDSRCAIEPGYQCGGEPSSCAPVCGDGEIHGAESCDNGNALGGDGCSAACRVEHGFICEGEPSVCTATCGDRLVASSEACDDGDTLDDDGCSAVCQVEPGFTCKGEPSVCAPVCGDGVIGPGEECDDKNGVGGDGCSAGCAVEAGFTCALGAPSMCTPTCGDGMVVAGEGCDDANTASGDGCGASCDVELGYGCSGSPSACAPVCGDGLVVRPGETCDDGNTAAGDCCSALCLIESGCEVEPNDSTLDADARAKDAYPIEFNGGGAIRGSISAAGDLDTFALFLSPATSVLRLETFNGTGADCAGGMATKLLVYDASTLALKSDMGGGIDDCSALMLSLPSGAYYLRVAQAQNNAVIPRYTLEADVQSSAGAEIEPNDGMSQATTVGGTSMYIVGSHQYAADTDHYKITIAGPGSKSVRAEIIEGGAETCESGGIASRLTLLSANGAVLADDDIGAGRGLCSKIDGTGVAALHPGAHGLSPGDYYLRVRAASGVLGQGAQFDYKLAVTIR